jgi:Tfp pilus assembly protein PilO
MTSRDRKILLGLALVLLLAGFWFVAIKPKRGEAKALDAQIATQQSRLETAQATIATGVKAKAQNAGDQAVVAKLGQAVPADEDLPSLLFDLDAVAGESHVDFRGVSRGSSTGAAAAAPATTDPTTAAAALPPGAVVGTAGIATLPFAFNFTGSFFSLERFLGDVQDFVQARDGRIAVHGRLLSIDGVSLVPAANDLSKITANVAATAYLAPDDKAASATSATTGTSTTAPSVASGAAPTTTTTNQITEDGNR